MGLLGWIKRESLPHRRRESAPPIIKIDPNVTRDAAYVEKLANFNKWRHSHANNPQLNSTSDFVGLGNEQWRPIDVNIDDVDVDGMSDISSDVGLTEKERQTLMIENRNLDLITSHQPKKVTKKSVDFYRNINKIPQSYELPAKIERKDSKRFSLPAKMSKTATCLGKEFSFRKKSKKQIVQNNNTIYEDEVEEYEQKHCKLKGNGTTKGQAIDHSQAETPPSRFYKENSNPYQNDMFTSSQQPLLTSPPMVTHHETFYSTPKKSTYTRRRQQSTEKYRPKADNLNTSIPKVLYHSPPPVNKESDSDSSSTLQSDTCYRNNDDNKMSVFDEFVVAVTNEPAPNVKSDNLSKLPKMKRRRQSPPYQTVINKHGDVVEYALPYSEETTTDDQSEPVTTPPLHQPPPPNTPISVHPNKVCHNLSLMRDLKQLESVVNENFKFLHDRQNVTGTSSTLPNDTLEPPQEGGERHEHSKQKVTDLDKSNGSTATTLSRYVSPRNSKIAGDGFLELDCLGNWSKNIQMTDDLRRTPQKIITQNGLDYFLKTHSLLICWPSEIKYRDGQLKSAFPSPLDFSSGCFRNMPVIVRKSPLNVEKNLLRFAEQATKRDFEVMCQIRHADMATLMAITFDQSVNQISLILEPFDFTLNHFLHQMDKRMSLMHCITIVQQIAQATLYLQECGYVHSNISSHSILMRKFPYAVKLSCFELATDAMSDEVKREIETNLGITSQRASMMRTVDYRNLPKYSQLLRNSEKYLKEKYLKLSKDPPYKRTSSGCDTLTKRPEMLSKYLPYHLPYRKKFSLHYYQAPELLAKSKARSFVYPQKNSDVYSLTLLLWEVLNQCVPFVIFNYEELEQLYDMNQAILPIFEEERCKDFRKVFEYGLEISVSNRIMSAQNLIGMLEDVKQKLMDAGESKTMEQTLFEEHLDEPEPEIRRGAEVNDISKHNLFEKTEKHYFNANTSPDPQKREENAITNEHLETLGIFNFTDAEVLKMSGMDATSTDNRSSEFEQNIQESFVGCEQTPSILLDDVARKIQADTGSLIKELHTPIAPKSNNQQKQVNSHYDSPAKLQGSSLNWSHSTIHQSTIDFNPRKLPKTENQPIYERTSTLKKRKKLEGVGQRGAIKELFNLPPDDSVPSPEKYDDLDRELDEIDNRFDRDDFLAEIMNELNVRSPGNSIFEPMLVQVKEVKTPAKKTIQREKQTFLNNLLKGTDSSKESQKSNGRRSSKGAGKRQSSRQKDRELSKSIEHLETTPKAQSNATKKQIRKTQISSGPGSYRFDVGDFTLPETPIARRNKIRRNAWLSDQQIKVSPASSPEVQEQPKVPVFPKMSKPKETTLQQNIELRNLSQPFSPEKKELNVRVKVIHNRQGVDSFTSYNLEPFTVKNDLNSSILGMIKLTDTSMNDNLTEPSPEVRIRVEPIQKKRETKKSTIPKAPPFVPKEPTHQLNQTVFHPTTAANGLNTKRLNKTTSQLDETNGRIRPNMPEILSEAFKKQRDRSLDKQNVFENNLWRREKNRCSTAALPVADASAAHRKSVREVIKSIETAFKRPEQESNPTIVKTTNVEQSRNLDVEKPKKPTPMVSKLNVTLSAPADIEIPKIPATLPWPNRSTSQSYVQKTIVRESFVTDMMETSTGMDSTIGSTKKKLTTRVTVNMKKISRRSSDVDMFRRPCVKEECVRHSFGGSELMRTLSGKPPTDEKKVVDSLAPAGSFGTPVGQKMVCCNCGSPQIVDLQNLPEGSTFAIPALRDINVTDGFRNSIFDDGGRLTELGTPLRKVSTVPIFQIARTPTTRSTEDLYIDDDFGQDLGANMELFEVNDDMDFGEIFTTEILQHDEVEQEINDPGKLKQLESPQEKAAIEPAPVAGEANETNNLISFLEC